MSAASWICRSSTRSKTCSSKAASRSAAIPPARRSPAADYALTNAEYRFPILNVDRGQSTLPLFVNRITGAAFVDYGSAFDDFQHARNSRSGVGAEAWFDMMLGYVETFTFRVGFARGLSSGGISQAVFRRGRPVLLKMTWACSPLSDELRAGKERASLVRGAESPWTSSVSSSMLNVPRSWRNGRVSPAVCCRRRME